MNDSRSAMDARLCHFANPKITGSDGPGDPSYDALAATERGGFAENLAETPEGPEMPHARSGLRQAEGLGDFAVG